MVSPNVVACGNWRRLLKSVDCQIPSKAFRIQNSRNEAWAPVFLRVPAVSSASAGWLEPLAVRTSGMITEALKVPVESPQPWNFLTYVLDKAKQISFPSVSFPLKMVAGSESMRYVLKK